MRVALLGKNIIGIEIIKILQSNSLCDIDFITPNNDDTGQDGWQLSLLRYAEENKLPVKRFEKINSSSSVEFLVSRQLDFIFSVQYDQIINQRVIDATKYGAINLHFAPLPKYRGISPIAFAMMNGEKEFGVSLHYMDPGVDTGDIIAQKIFPITHLSNARELYDLSVKNGIELFKEAINQILSLVNPRIPQDNSEALYYSRGSISFKENKINWNRDTRSLYHWIKAFIFPPFQYPVFEYMNIMYEVVGVSPDFRKNGFEKPGTLVFKSNNYYKFATHDCYINVITKKNTM